MGAITNMRASKKKALKIKFIFHLFHNASFGLLSVQSGCCESICSGNEQLVLSCAWRGSLPTGAVITGRIGHLTDISLKKKTLWRMCYRGFLYNSCFFFFFSLLDLPILWWGFHVSTVSRWLLTSCLLTNMSLSRPRWHSTSWRGNLRTCAGRWDTFYTQLFHLNSI